MNLFKSTHASHRGAVEESLSSFISVESFDKETGLFGCDDSLPGGVPVKSKGFAIECAFNVNVVSSSIAEQFLSQVLNQEFPANTILQVISYRLVVSSILSTQFPMDSESLAEQVQAEHEAFFQSSVNGEGAGFVYDQKLLLTVKVPGAGDSELINSLLHNSLRILDAAGLDPRVLNDSGLAAHYRNILGGCATVADGTSIGNNFKQCATQGSAIQIERDHLKLSGIVAKSYSAKFIARQIAQTPISVLLQDMKANYLICCNIVVPDQSKATRSLRKIANVTSLLANSPIVYINPQIKQAHTNYVDTVGDLDSGSSLLCASLHCVVFGDQLRDVYESVHQSISTPNLRHFKFMADDNVHLPVFVNCLPLCAEVKGIAALRRSKTVSSATVVKSLPVGFESTLRGRFGVPLVTQSGQMSALSLNSYKHRSPLHLLIAGASGSGKSVLAKALTCYQISNGSHALLVDYGKGSDTFFDAFRSSSVSKIESAIPFFNPFSSADCIEGIVSPDCSMDSLRCSCGDLTATLIQVMLEEEYPLSSAESSAIRFSVRSVWQANFRQTTLNDVARVLLENEYPHLQALGVRLSRVIMKLDSFDGASPSVKTADNLTYYDLNAWQSPLLRKVSLAATLIQIIRDLHRNSSVHKVIVLDEVAHSVLQDSVSLNEIVLTLYRSARKFNASVIFSAQSLEEIYSTHVGVTIAQLSEIKLFSASPSMYLNPEKLTKFGFSDSEINLLNSLSASKRTGAEFMFVDEQMVSDSHSGVVRLVLTPKQQLLFSHNLNDRHRTQTLIKSGLSISGAVDEILIENSQNSHNWNASSTANSVF